MDARGDAGGTYVVFRLNGEEYGLPIDKVQSIIRYEEPTPVPRSPEAIRGVINLRGRVIPVVDLTRRLLGAAFAPGPASRIVVAEGDTGLLGLIVDAANEVASIPDESIRPAPDSVLTEETASAFSGVADRDGRLIVLLDLDEVVAATGFTGVGVTGSAGEDDTDVK